jgi:hypothetical protein
MSNLLKKVVTGISAFAMVLTIAGVPTTTQAATAGEVYKTTDGTVWFVTSDMQKRAFTSAGAFLSYGFLSFSQVKDATAEVIALPTGSMIAPQDGRIFCATETKGSDVKGECSLITAGMKAAFTSSQVFSGLGFSFGRAYYGDSSFLSKTSNIASAGEAHRAGVLVNNGGTIQLVVNGGLWGTPSLDVFNSWGWSFSDVVPANGADKTMTQTGVISARTAGQLSPSASTNPGTQVGPISASAASSNPVSGTIVAGQATAGLLDVTFSGNGTLSTVMLKRTGISDQNTLTNVYLYDGATRLTDGYSFNSTGDITINNLALPVNGSKTISVKADVASSASSGQTIMVALNGFMAAGSTASTTVVNGNTMAVASGSTLASASLSANTVASATVNAGTSAYVFWSAPLQINTRTQQLKAANFRMIGSAPSDALSNIKLFVDGVDTGKVANMTVANGSNYANFDFMSTPKSLTTGSHTVEVRADIVKGSNRNVQFSIQNASDLMIMDPQVGVNLAVTGTIANNAGTITIGSGSLTAVQDPTFQSQTNVTGGASNTVIGKAKLRAYGEDIKVQTLAITPIGSAVAAGLQNVTLYFNGSQVGTQQSYTGAGSLTFNLGSQLIVPAGSDSTLEIRTDLRNTLGSNITSGTIGASLVAGSSNGQGQNSFNTVSTPALTGNTLTVQTGNLQVGKNTSFANQSANPNTAGVKIGSFVLQNQSTSESVRVTTLKVDLSGSSALTNLSALRTSETSGSGSTPVQPQATNTFSVQFELAPGATKTVDVFADSSSATGVTVISTLTVTSTGVNSNVTTAGSAVTGQTITLASGTLATPTLVAASSTVAQYIAAGNGGSTDGSKATFNFVSSNASSTISELTFTVSALNTVSSIKVGDKTAPVVGTTAYLTGLNIAVPNGGSGLNQDVYVTYSEVGTSGITPVTLTAVSLTAVKYTSGGVTATFNPSVSAPIMTLVGSKPTVTVPSTTATGLSISAESKIGEVTVSADAKGNVKLNDIVFNVSSSGFSTACTAAGLVVTCEFGSSLNTDFDGFTITAGTSKTFSLFASLTGAIATGSGIPTISTSLVTSTFNWDDASTNGVAGTGVNLSGTGIYNFPTSSYSVRQ